uniref:Endosulphine n=2 Tax=Aegilops tauschii subsp. strangulata TaxID=200361 RepID=A0A453F6P1_AEGTS
MSGMPSDDASAQMRLEGEVSGEKVEDTQDENEGSGMPSPQEEEAAIKKKYGGKMPKKSPLISKDHERAFFDSADWALGKQGGSPNKPKGPLEALRPKLQPTQQNARARRSSYASADNDGTPYLRMLSRQLPVFDGQCSPSLTQHCLLFFL